MKARVSLCCIAALMSGVAQSKPAPATRAKSPIPFVTDLARCKSITVDAQRLDCYDRAAGALLAAEAKSDIIVVDREQVEQASNAAFGFRQPDADLLRRHGAKMERMDRLDGVLASASSDSGGQWTFRLQDGAVWQQVDTNELSLMPRRGDAVVISRASLGGYRLSVAKTPGVRVRRIR